MESRNKKVSGTERKISLSEPLELGNGEWEGNKGVWEPARLSSMVAS